MLESKPWIPNFEVLFLVFTVTETRRFLQARILVAFPEKIAWPEFHQRIYVISRKYLCNLASISPASTQDD